MTTAESELRPGLRVYIANCLIGGDEITQTGSSWIRDLVSFNVAGTTVRLRQKPEVINGPISDLTDRFIETSEATIEGITTEGVAEAKAMIERICWLLSFAGTCRVIPYGYEYPANSGLKQVQSVSGAARHFRPAFEIRDGSLVVASRTIIRTLMKQAWLRIVPALHSLHWGFALQSRLG